VAKLPRQALAIVVEVHMSVPPMNKTTNCILVIHDDPLTANQLRRAFRDALPSAQVIVASCGADAAHLMDRGSFDLIVLDLVLRKETGYDLMPELIARAPRTPIVMLSTHDNEVTRHLCRERGACAFEGTPTTAEGFAELALRLREYIAHGPISLWRAVN